MDKLKITKLRQIIQIQKDIGWVAHIFSNFHNYGLKIDGALLKVKDVLVASMCKDI